MCAFSCKEERRILFPFEENEDDSKSALRYILKHIHREGDEIILLHVVPTSYRRAYHDTMVVGLKPESEIEWREKCADFVERVFIPILKDKNAKRNRLEMVSYDPSERSVGEVIVRKREEHDVCFIFMCASQIAAARIFSRIVRELRFTSKFKASDAVQERREDRNAGVGVNFSSALTTVPPGNTNITIYILILLSNLMCARGFFENHDAHVPKCSNVINSTRFSFLKKRICAKSFTNIFSIHASMRFIPNSLFSPLPKPFQSARNRPILSRGANTQPLRLV